MDNDNDLMLAFKDGDEDAFNVLFNKHLKNVLNILYRFIRDSNIAEDLAQEVFLMVYRSKDRYKPTAKFTTFLYTIATNLALNYIRDNQKKKFVNFSELNLSDSREETILQLENPKAEKPSEKIERIELQQIISDAVMQLPEKQRIALYLSKYLGLSHSEISEIMNQSVAAVKSLLSRARDNMRKYLSQAFNKSKL